MWNVLRGWDATGVAGVREQQEGKERFSVVTTHKRALAAYDFLDTRGAKKFMDRFSEYYYVIGHVRASTIGADTDLNAHPFHYEDIVLVHNGTVSTNNLDIKIEETVDSAHIAAYMAKHGEKETLEKLDGGFSLVWYNQADDSLNFARNERRPMALAFVDGKNELYYGSEFFTLWAVLKRNQLAIENGILATRPGVHYKFHKEDLREFTATPFKAFVRPQYPATSHNNWGRGNLQPVVHQPQKNQSQKSTDTVSDATAHSANSSNTTTTKNNTEPPSTSTTDGAATSQERVTFVNKTLAPFGLHHHQSCILRPFAFATYPQNSGKGRVLLESDLDEDDLEYVMYQVSSQDYLKFEKAGGVAVRIVNVATQTNGPLRVICKHDAHLQAVLERNADALEELKEAGFSSKEDSKSDDEAAVCIVNTKTGEIVDAEEDIIEDRNIQGPNGAWITASQFKRLAEQNCGNCDGPIELSDHRHVSFVNDIIICPGCTKLPAVTYEMQRREDAKRVN